MRFYGERVLDFSKEAASLRVRLGQLLIKRENQPDISTPLDEIAILMLATARVTCTQSVLSGVMDAGGVVLVCDGSMMPNGMMLPLAAHHAHTQRMRSQVSASAARRKRVWQQIVQAKIQAQASVLELRTNGDHGLRKMADRVRSGDPDNIEAQAAQRYWPLVFGNTDFRRRRDAGDENRLLNYGYAVLRAAVARSICASGLHPSIGVHHRSRSNPFCLADDLMEPWRSLVDAEVAEISAEWGGDVALDTVIKKRLIGILHDRIRHNGESRTVLAWISRSAASLAENLCGDIRPERIRILFPEGLVGLWQDDETSG